MASVVKLSSSRPSDPPGWDITGKIQELNQQFEDEQVKQDANHKQQLASIEKKVRDSRDEIQREVENVKQQCEGFLQKQFSELIQKFTNEMIEPLMATLDKQLDKQVATQVDLHLQRVKLQDEHTTQKYLRKSALDKKIHAVVEEQISKYGPGIQDPTPPSARRVQSPQEPFRAVGQPQELPKKDHQDQTPVVQPEPAASAQMVPANRTSKLEDHPVRQTSTLAASSPFDPEDVINPPISRNVDKTRPPKRRADQSPDIENSNHKRARHDAQTQQLDAFENRMRSPAKQSPTRERLSTPRSRQAAEDWGPAQRPIPFEEIYQDGKAKYKHKIMEVEAFPGKFVILRCDEHGVHFGWNPLHGAAKHIHSPQHDMQEKRHELAIELCGHLITGCTAELAEKNNMIFDRAIREGYKPLNRNLLRKADRLSLGSGPDIGRKTSPTKVNGEIHINGSDKVEVGTDKAKSGRPFKGISNPVEGNFYLGFWPRNKVYYPIIVLPVREDGSLNEVGLDYPFSQTKLLSTIPKCYHYDRTSLQIKGWQKSFQDGGVSVNKREFPVMYFDSPERSSMNFGWLAAKNLREIDFDDPEANYPQFEDAKLWYAELKGRKSYEEYKRQGTRHSTPVDGEKDGQQESLNASHGLRTDSGTRLKQYGKIKSKETVSSCHLEDPESDVAVDDDDVWPEEPENENDSNYVGSDSDFNFSDVETNVGMQEAHDRGGNEDDRGADASASSKEQHGEIAPSATENNLSKHLINGGPASDDTRPKALDMKQLQDASEKRRPEIPSYAKDVRKSAPEMSSAPERVKDGIPEQPGKTIPSVQGDRLRNGAPAVDNDRTCHSGTPADQQATTTETTDLGTLKGPVSRAVLETKQQAIEGSEPPKKTTPVTASAYPSLSFPSSVIGNGMPKTTNDQYRNKESRKEGSSRSIVDQGEITSVVDNYPGELPNESHNKATRREINKGPENNEPFDNTTSQAGAMASSQRSKMRNLREADEERPRGGNSTTTDGRETVSTGLRKESAVQQGETTAALQEPLSSVPVRSTDNHVAVPVSSGPPGGVPDIQMLAVQALDRALSDRSRPTREITRASVFSHNMMPSLVGVLRPSFDDGHNGRVRSPGESETRARPGPMNDKRNEAQEPMNLRNLLSPDSDSVTPSKGPAGVRNKDENPTLKRNDAETARSAETRPRVLCKPSRDPRLPHGNRSAAHPPFLPPRPMSPLARPDVAGFLPPRPNATAVNTQVGTPERPPPATSVSGANANHKCQPQNRSQKNMARPAFQPLLSNPSPPTISHLPPSPLATTPEVSAGLPPQSASLTKAQGMAESAFDHGTPGAMRPDGNNKENGNSGRWKVIRRMQVLQKPQVSLTGPVLPAPGGAASATPARGLSNERSDSGNGSPTFLIHPPANAHTPVQTTTVAMGPERPASSFVKGEPTTPTTLSTPGDDGARDFDVAQYSDGTHTFERRRSCSPPDPYLQLHKVAASPRMAPDMPPVSNEIAIATVPFPVTVNPARVDRVIVEHLCKDRTSVSLMLSAGDGDQRFVFETKQLAMGTWRSGKIQARSFASWVRSVNPDVQYQNDSSSSGSSRPSDAGPPIVVD